MDEERDYWRRRRKIFEDPFRYFDEVFREMIEELEREFERHLSELERPPFDVEELKKRGARVYGPFIYGFRITLGPDGRYNIEEFGNVKRVRGRPLITEEREPLVDIFESDDEVTVVCELPGVDKEKINVEVGGDRKTLIIRASDTNRKYYKEVELPAEVDPGSAKASYKNGILEVKLKKVGGKKEGFKVKVE